MRLYFLFIFFFSIHLKASEALNWQGLDKGKIELAYPLLTVRGSKGFLACAYVNSEICDKTKEACAIVTGVKTHDDMLLKKIIAVSKEASDLGIKNGMSGQEALNILR